VGAEPVTVTVGIQAPQLEHSFTGARPLSSMSNYTMIPGPETLIDDPGLLKLAKTADNLRRALQPNMETGMINSRNLFVTIVLLGLIISVATQKQVLADPTAENSVQRLRREGIRAKASGNPEKLAAAGFNVAIPWGSLLYDAKKTTSPDSATVIRPEDFSEEAIEKLRSRAVECKKNNIFMMDMMYFATEPTIRFLAGIEPEPNGQ
jgi:hypothetical protein